MKLPTVEEFLTAYKSLENTIADVTGDPDKNLYWLEQNTANAESQAKIKVIRNIRNYCQHNTYKNFIAITPEMIECMKAIEKDFLYRTQKIKDVMKRIQPADESQTIHDAIKAIVGRKIPMLPVTDKNGVLSGVLTEHHICTALAGNDVTLKTKLSQIELKKTLKDVTILNPDTPAKVLKDVSAEYGVVCDKNNAVKGIWRK